MKTQGKNQITKPNSKYNLSVALSTSNPNLEPWTRR